MFESEEWLGFRKKIHKTFYYVSQLVRALLWVNSAGRILLYGPINLKERLTDSERPINLVFSVRIESHGSPFFLPVEIRDIEVYL